MVQVSNEFRADALVHGVDIEGAEGQPITFPGCAEPTLGVELEVSLVDLKTRNLAPRAPEVLERLGDHEHAKPELFRTIIELNTGICRNVGEVRRDLGQRLSALREVCQALEIGCLCTGSHPIADW